MGASNSGCGTCYVPHTSSCSMVSVEPVCLFFVWLSLYMCWNIKGRGARKSALRAATSISPISCLRYYITLFLSLCHRVDIVVSNHCIRSGAACGCHTTLCVARVVATLHEVFLLFPYLYILYRTHVITSAVCSVRRCGEIPFMS